MPARSLRSSRSARVFWPAPRLANVNPLTWRNLLCEETRRPRSVTSSLRLRLNATQREGRPKVALFPFASPFA
jgi:hypothetical protein